MPQDHTGKVYNPSTGKYFLLQCHTHNKQNFVVLVKSQKNIDLIFKSICEEELDDNLKIRALWHIEMVAPSEKLLQQAKKRLFDQQVENFMLSVFCQLRSYFKDKNLPAIFEKCDNFQPKDCEDPSTDDDYHFECVNCKYGYRLVGYNPEDFYCKFYTLWSNSFGQDEKKSETLYSKKHPQLQASKARPVQENEELWATACSSWHGGVDCRRIYSDEYGLDTVNTGVLFYFLKLQELEITGLQETLIHLKQETKKNKEKYIQDFKQRRELEKNNIQQKILEIFNAR